MYCDYFYIETYVASVGDWKNLISDIRKVLSMNEKLGLAFSAIGTIKTAHDYIKNIAKITTLAGLITSYIGLEIDYMMILLGGALDKIDREIGGMSDDETYIFNWRVARRYGFISNQQTVTLQSYCPFAEYYNFWGPLR